jgi:type I restriction enzyme S subunit
VRQLLPAFKASEVKTTFHISAPDLYKTQTAIAEILSSLDDKIELNNKINQELENLAQTLFKQWFIDFEFPANLADTSLSEGYKSSGGEMVESELGEIPKGWKIGDLSNITEKITDGAHASPKSVDNGYCMASVKDMESWSFNISSCRIISDHDFNNLVRQGCKPQSGDVLIAKDGSFLKHVFIHEEDIDIVLLSSIAILRPNNLTNPYVLCSYLKEKSVKERLSDIVTGAVIQRIVLKDFRKFKIPLYPESLQKSFLTIVNPFYNLIWKTLKENQSLTKLRDTLLPKLISGELEVSDANSTLKN